MTVGIPPRNPFIRWLILLRSEEVPNTRSHSSDLATLCGQEGLGVEERAPISAGTPGAR